MNKHQEPLMFGAIGNLAALVKQAQQISGRLEGLNNELRGRRATGAAGGGLVEVEVNGLNEVLGCRIDPALLAQNDRELLEDLVREAVNQALAKARQLHAEAMKSLAGGIELPGLDEALSRLTGGASS